LLDGHGGAALEQFHHHALVGRVEVLDDDKCHAAVFGNVGEELFQRLQSARRSADADNGKGGLRRFDRRCGRLFLFDLDDFGRCRSLLWLCHFIPRIENVNFLKRMGYR
jgi:hypothetical protein